MALFVILYYYRRYFILPRNKTKRMKKKREAIKPMVLESRKVKATIRLMTDV